MASSSVFSDPTPPASSAQAGVFAGIAAALRLLPSFGLAVFNFTPAGGFGVFAGAKVRSWLAYGLSAGVLIVTDLVLTACLGDTYAPWHSTRCVDYLALLGYVLLGRLFSRYGMVGLGAAALLGSVQFFLITNFAWWLENGPLTLSGLLLAYQNAIPFYRNTLASDLVFPFAFLGLHYLWQRLAQAATQPVEATQP